MVRCRYAAVREEVKPEESAVTLKRKRVAGTALTAKEMRQLQLSQFVTSVHPGRRPQVSKIEPSVTGGNAILYCYEEVMKRNRSLSFDTADDLIMCGAVALTEQTFTPERQRYQVYRAIASLLGYHVRTPLPAVLEAGVKAQWPNQSEVKELVASPRPSRIRNSQEDPLQRGIQALDAGRIVLEKAVELVSSIVDRQKLDDLPWEPRPDPAWPSAQKSEDDEVSPVHDFNWGPDDISVTIEWALRELLKDSCILEKAQAEMDSVVGRERLVNESNLPNLPYLNAIVMETFRRIVRFKATRFRPKHQFSSAASF
ncbi:hypothetical protein R1sor_006024 [Riccia sorocarpa]|uniref:Uncharacterized protein n=1 Tax=Riccia sorocarpa TaxID=122646 RepID=A0ABD3HL93_9MARC